MVRGFDRSAARFPDRTFTSLRARNLAKGTSSVRGRACPIAFGAERGESVLDREPDSDHADPVRVRSHAGELENRQICLLWCYE